MGEARKRLNRRIANGHALARTAKRVPTVTNLKLQNRDGYIYLILGNDEPELAFAMTADNARTLSESLLGHVAALEETAAPRTDTPTDARRIRGMPGRIRSEASDSETV